MTDLDRGLYFENKVDELHYREVLKHVYKLVGHCGHVAVRGVLGEIVLEGDKRQII